MSSNLKDDVVEDSIVFLDHSSVNTVRVNGIVENLVYVVEDKIKVIDKEDGTVSKPVVGFSSDRGCRVSVVVLL